MILSYMYKVPGTHPLFQNPKHIREWSSSMQVKLFSASLWAVFALTTFAVALASQLSATEQVIHSFTDGLDGVQARTTV
jgi:hypothetical protein